MSVPVQEARSMALLFIRRVEPLATHREWLLLQDKLVAAVCHGPGALTEAELNGKPLVKDKKVQLSPLLLPDLCPVTGASAQAAMWRISILTRGHAARTSHAALETASTAGKPQSNCWVGASVQVTGFSNSEEKAFGSDKVLVTIT